MVWDGRGLGASSRVGLGGMDLTVSWTVPVTTMLPVTASLVAVTVDLVTMEDFVNWVTYLSLTLCTVSICIPSPANISIIPHNVYYYFDNYDIRQGTTHFQITLSVRQMIGHCMVLYNIVFVFVWLCIVNFHGIVWTLLFWPVYLKLHKIILYINFLYNFC